jgi:hypothetical protein
MLSVTMTLVLLASAATAAGPRELLSRARQLYNAGKYEEAIEAARGASLSPEFAARARIVLARASLERFRRLAEPSDLVTARETLAQVKAADLGSDDRLDLTIATGESLYLDDKAGAAAEQFELALGRIDPKHAEGRELILDWWANALDRQAQVVSAAEARAIEMRIVSRMEEELRRDEESAVASYWLVSGARGMGDVERAWSGRRGSRPPGATRPRAPPSIRALLRPGTWGSAGCGSCCRRPPCGRSPRSARRARRGLPCGSSRWRSSP